MAQIKSFTFFASYYDAISCLSDEEKAKILIAMCEYVFNGKEPRFDNLMVEAFWKLMVPTLNKSIVRSFARQDTKEEQKNIKTKSNQNQNKIKIKSKRNQNEIKNESNTSKDKEKEKDSHTTNVDMTLDKEKKEDKSSSKKRYNYLAEFEEDFMLYHRKGGKKKAYERWQTLSEDEKERMRRHIPFYWQSNDPQYLKDFEGYINQRLFESPVYDKRNGKIIFDPDQTKDKAYNPALDTIHRQSDGTFLYWGNYHEWEDNGGVIDGYDDDDRPDGATLVMNNARGTIIWNANEKKWRREK